MGYITRMITKSLWLNKTTAHALVPSDIIETEQRPTPQKTLLKSYLPCSSTLAGNFLLWIWGGSIVSSACVFFSLSHMPKGIRGIAGAGAWEIPVPKDN